MTRIVPLRRMVLQWRQIFLTDALTFMILSVIDSEREMSRCSAFELQPEPRDIACALR
jgi:hypothetical protein